MQKKNGFVEFHHFMKKERLSNSSKSFLNCKQKKCEEISMTRLRHVDYLHSSSIYLQESENKTEQEIKSKVKIIATMASQS